MKKFFLLIIFALTNSQIFAHELLTTAQKKFKIELKGLIQIGAFDGSEAKFYKSLGIKNTLWIEADPKTFATLVQNIKPNGTSCIAENFAASNENGTIKFFRTSNVASSSLLELKIHKSIHPEVKFTESIDVMQKPLDQYFQDSKNDVSNYNTIVIDIQGAELMALRGAINTLKNIDCIVSEVNYAELYEGGVKIWELDAFLLEQGFVRVDTISVTNGWGDALYIKQTLLPK